MVLAVTKYKKYFIKRLISTPSDSRFKELAIVNDNHIISHEFELAASEPQEYDIL